jgi:polar amino acid transport system permease protein
MRQEGARGVLIATVSAIVFFGLIGWIVVHSPGWPAIKQNFFNRQEFVDTFPKIVSKFRLNILYALIAEALILMLALLIAVLRSLPGSVFFPLRAMAIGYTDLFRGIPTILLIYLLGFGVPAMQLQGVPRSPTFWGVVALVLSYSAYVAEVYRAGIESVHASQAAAARSLGLSRMQAMRSVVLPQAVRRVIPPLMNDFLGLQKDTALLSVVVVIPEAVRRAYIDSAGDFNYTPFVEVALLFLLVTIPLTRLVDWLLARQRRRREAGNLV